ncbi:hypothetical protein FB559_0297 [Actinoallomurus bryophytorum]|uniref:Uncharacterized protein n=1 Tax=Actinoallomurus bryophytorum TaxID=1490222 RepID=A0A543CCJ6_9ACTN|nr:hypothetical protein FB559_0297 [Actinoallomurus bryophytorum]
MRGVGVRCGLAGWCVVALGSGPGSAACPSGRTVWRGRALRPAGLLCDRPAFRAMIGRLPAGPDCVAWACAVAWRVAVWRPWVPGRGRPPGLLAGLCGAGVRSGLAGCCVTASPSGWGGPPALRAGLWRGAGCGLRPGSCDHPRPLGRAADLALRAPHCVSWACAAAWRIAVRPPRPPAGAHHPSSGPNRPPRPPGRTDRPVLRAEPTAPSSGPNRPSRPPGRTDRPAPGQGQDVPGRAARSCPPAQLTGPRSAPSYRAASRHRGVGRQGRFRHSSGGPVAQ